MVFISNNSNQEFGFDSNIYGCDNNNLDPQLDDLFVINQDFSNSSKQISFNSTIPNPNPQLTSNEGLDLSNSENPHLHGENIKITNKRRKSSEEDDKLLMELVKNYGTKKWNFIAQEMSVRTGGKKFKGSQLWDRYNYHLKPGIQKEAWSEEEDSKLVKAHEILGNKWVEIAKVLPGRSPGNIKNRWNTNLRKCLRAIKQSTNPKPISLFENYVKSILTERDQKGPITTESNAVVGQDGNGQCLANSLNGRTCSSDPIEMPRENNVIALPGEINGRSSFSHPNELFFDLDQYIDLVEKNGPNVIEPDTDAEPEGNEENFDGSNAFSISFEPNKLPSEKNETTTAQRSNGMCSSSDQNELFYDGSEEDWDSLEELIYS